MKNLFFSIISALLIFSCKKNPEPQQPAPVPTPPYFGTVSVLKNGAEWTASPYAGHPGNIPNGNYIFIQFDSLDQNGVRKENCYVTWIPLSLGKHPVQLTYPNPDITQPNGGFSYIEEGDFSHGKYEIVASDTSNYVTLSSYDQVTKEITGSFELTFSVLYYPNPSAPDTIRLRNGVFHTKISN